jgi:hypothetical protein
MGALSDMTRSPFIERTVTGKPAPAARVERQTAKARP